MPKIIKRIGFGSCHNQRKEAEKEVFASLTKQEFDLFVWSGDVVYNRESQVDTLQFAYLQTKQLGNYEKFASKLPFGVIGTWDDHDFGMNDAAGRDITGYAERKALFWDFLQVAQDSPLRKQEDGVYSSHVFPGVKPDQSIKFILLDTRSGRSPYFISALGSLGEGHWYGKLSPVLAAAARSFSQVTNLSHLLAYHHISNDDMLSAKQWQWLEEELNQSKSQVNVLVSSVQVMTTNPSVESWGLFPNEQKRLLDLLTRTNPEGLLLLSGDVHVGQLVYENLEVTSSGLTHTCTDGGIPLWLCSFVFNLFLHDTGNTVYDRNFGQIDLDWESDKFTVTVQSLTDANNRLVLNRTFERLFNGEENTLHAVDMDGKVRFGLIFFLMWAIVVAVGVLRRVMIQVT